MNPGEPCKHNTAMKVGKQHGWELWRCDWGCGGYYAARDDDLVDARDDGTWLRWEADGLRYSCVHPESVQID